MWGRVDIFLIANRERRRTVENIRKATARKARVNRRQKRVRWQKFNENVIRSRPTSFSPTRRVSNRTRISSHNYSDANPPHLVTRFCHSGVQCGGFWERGNQLTRRRTFKTESHVLVTQHTPVSYHKRPLERPPARWLGLCYLISLHGILALRFDPCFLQPTIRRKVSHKCRVWLYQG